MKILHNINHLIEQAADRVKTHERKPFRLTSGHLNSLKAAILSNAPGDWRFTEKPEADFMVTFMCEGIPIKFVGRSYRESIDSEQLYRDLLGQGYYFKRNGEFDRKTVKWLAKRYLMCLADPAAEICHEFKTVLGSDQMLSTDFEDERGYYPHLMLQDRAHVGHNLKKRPNALVLPGPDGRLELWVRQGHPFLSVSAARTNIGSYCIFARLSPQGVTQDHGTVWYFDSWGNAECVGEAACGTPFRIGPNVRIYQGTRSKNYWDLPTHLDAKHMDTLFADRNCTRAGRKPDEATQTRLRLMKDVYQQASQINEAWIKKDRALKEQRYACNAS